MMKWKVVKNSRCVSADRSLECLRNKNFMPLGNDSNNNHCKPDTSDQNENSKQQDPGFVRKNSMGTSDCMNLKSFLGLSRQRSEVNLSNLGLSGHESRRSRSEVRGISCDRLTIGYHTPSIEPAKSTSTNEQTNKSGWLRGRKKEREVRNPQKSNTNIGGKTVVTGTKRANSKSSETRTIADQTSNVLLKNVTKLPSDGRVIKLNRNNDNETVKDDIYVEIEQQRLIEARVKGPAKPSRKKSQAPKPNTPSVLPKETNCDVNLNPNGQDSNPSTNCFIEKKMSPLIKPARKIHSLNGDRHTDNRTAPTVKLNNLKNSETFLTVKNKITSETNTYITVAEIHKNNFNDNKSEPENYIDHISENKINEDKIIPENTNLKIEKTCPLKLEKLMEENENIEETQVELPSYHIDTPDYSTLESPVNHNKNSPESTPMNILKNKTSSITDLINCITLNYSSTETEKPQLQSTISSILRDSSNEMEFAPKKVVRFEKLDLIEKYKKNKTENLKDSDEESVTSNLENKQVTIDTVLDVNSNEILPHLKTENIPIDSTNVSESGVSDKLSSSSSDCFSESLSTTTELESPQKSMTVNILIRNPAAEHHTNGEPQTDDTQTQLVVKKSFVLTVAKQEKGFRSLCANKKAELSNIEPQKTNHKISVTFLCSGTQQDIVENEPPASSMRLRSISVPPQILQKSEVVPDAFPPISRGRSRERRPKDRHHYKKNHKSKKKDSSHHMPQAVIDELAQVLEKRKPSLDKKTAPRSS